MVLALGQTALFVVMAAGEYWNAALFWRDFSQPITGRWCGANSGPTVSSAAMGWNLGAFVLALVPHTILTGRVTCFNEWNSARGLVYMGLCVPFA